VESLIPDSCFLSCVSWLPAFPRRNQTSMRDQWLPVTSIGIAWAFLCGGRLALGKERVVLSVQETAVRTGSG
jgi:hypothetical protein